MASEMTIEHLQMLQKQMEQMPLPKTKEWQMWVSPFWYKKAKKAAKKNKDGFLMKGEKVYFGSVEVICTPKW